jgi:tetratricopeptide (TPR) repeat protein
MKKLLVLFIFFAPLISFGQKLDYGNSADAVKLCGVVQSSPFINDVEAEDALDKILSVIGASKRFVLKPCKDINNAIAVSYKGIRYILYDSEFINSLSSINDNYWINMFILAHEVGHHINGHSMDLLLYSADLVEKIDLEESRNQELEADEFAGFVLAKLGASFSEASEAVASIPLNADDSYSTHPKKSKRLVAIKTGYNKSTGNPVAYEAISRNIATEYFYSALEKDENSDYYGAIADYSKAIEIEPKYIVAYFNRGYSKAKLNDHLGAVTDYTKTIDLDPKNVKAYLNRGSSKIELEDYYGSIADFNKVIELDPNRAGAYFNRGLSKAFLFDKKGACKDGRNAKKLGYDASELIKLACR